MPTTQSQAVSEPQTDVIPAIGTARLVPGPALRETALILDAVAGLIQDKNSSAVTGIRQIIADLEAGNRIERPCCDNQWRATLSDALGKTQ